MRQKSITKETFEAQQTVEGKLSILFDLQFNTAEALNSLMNDNAAPNSVYCSNRWNDCDKRFKRLERFGYIISGGISVISFGTAIVALLLQLTKLS